ncbi:MAG: hypothetical protein AB7Q17_12000 [Phycisphaerae bacterium]
MPGVFGLVTPTQTLVDDAHDQAWFSRRIARRAWDRGVFIRAAENLLITQRRGSRRGRRRNDHDDACDGIAVHAHQLGRPDVERWCDRDGAGDLLEPVRRAAPYL